MGVGGPYAKRAPELTLNLFQAEGSRADSKPQWNSDDAGVVELVVEVIREDEVDKVPGAVELSP